MDEPPYSVGATLEPTSRAQTAFVVACVFFAVASALGLLLRANHFWPVPGMTYGYVLHAHSHTAFLGWIYNAFFALALWQFVPADEVQSYWRVFLVTQVATIGMLVAFPFQGYARETIIFSTLHVVCSAVFAWKLLRRNRAARGARGFLLAAFAFLFASAIGPLALGVLSATGLRESPWYLFSIYVYLHFQYNGWFPCFLAAALLQQKSEDASTQPKGVAERWALPLVAAGIVLTLGISALWMQPPAWVWWLSGIGGVLQLMGFALLSSTMLKGARATLQGPARFLSLLAGCAMGLKLLLQATAVLPGFSLFVTHRLVAIGFLHLMFLLVVTPLLVAFALRWRWLRVDGWMKRATWSFFVGVLSTQAVLAYVPLSSVFFWPHLTVMNEVLLAGSAVLFAAVTLLALNAVSTLRLSTPRPR